VRVGELAAGVKEIQKHFEMTDGFDLFCRHWKAVGESGKSVVCIHGIGGHSEVFRVMGQDLAEDGIEVYALDLRILETPKKKTCQEEIPAISVGTYEIWRKE
jgi:dienelactone hydrolase